MRQHITKGLVTGALAVFLGLSAAACDDEGGGNTTEGTGGNGGAGGSGGSGGSGGESSQGEQYVDAVCGKLFACCNAKDLVARVGNTGIVDYAGCRIFYRTFWEGGYESTVKEAEASGRAEFDETAFAACLDSLKAQTCGEFATANFAGCNAFIIAKVDKGGACAQSFECKTKACEIPDGATMGTCVDAPAPAAEGGACAENDGCAKDLFCEKASGTCAQKKVDGQACSSNTECQNNACVDAGNGMKTCATLCQGGGPGPGDIDAALESVGGAVVIAECKRTFACCTEQERTDSLFDTESECRLITGAFFGIALVNIHNDVAEGRVSVDPAKLASCVQAYEMLSCEASAKDDGFECTGAIVGLVADGQSCTNDRQCTSTYCNKPSGQSMGTCATLPGAGAPCTDACAESFYCAAGTCAPQKADGAACNMTTECAEGRCMADGMGAKTCRVVCDGI